MVDISYAFQDSQDHHGTPVFKLGAEDFAYLGGLYDTLRETFAGLTITHYPTVYPRSIPASQAQPIKDGQHLQDRLQNGSHDLQQAYVVSLQGQQQAVIIDYAPQSRRSHPYNHGHREPPPRFDEPADLYKIARVRLVNNLQKVPGKERIWGTEWHGDYGFTATNAQTSKRSLDSLTRWTARFAHRVQKANLSL